MAGYWLDMHEKDYVKFKPYVVVVLRYYEFYCNVLIIIKQNVDFVLISLLHFNSFSPV